MRYLRLLVVLIGTTALTACLNSSTIVKIKPDGSGTVEQTMLVNTSALKAMMPGAEKQAGGGTQINKADLEATAARMGKGVRLLSAEPMKDAAGFEGTKAIYAFDDINQIQISQDPNMSGGTSNRLSTEPTSDDPVKFKLTRGAGGSTLSINFVDKPSGTRQVNPAGGGDTPDLTNPMVMNMIKTMFQGFKVNIAMEVEGKIVKTNAEYVEGSRITLLDLELATLLADEAKFKALQAKLGPDVSLSTLKPYLKDIKGIKIDGPSINVEFK